MNYDEDTGDLLLEFYARRLSERGGDPLPVTRAVVDCAPSFQGLLGRNGNYENALKLAGLAPKNTRIWLQYRDASNYKTQPVPVIFGGEPTRELIDRLIAGIEGEDENSGSFIAEQVGLEKPSFGGVYEDDHCWTDIEVDPEPCTMNVTDPRTFAEFVAEVEAVEVWDDTGGPVAELVNLFHKHPPLDESQEAERVEQIKDLLLNSFSGAFWVGLPQRLYDIAHGRTKP